MFEGTIWVVAVRDGTFYGQAMTAGDIYNIAGAVRRPATACRRSRRGSATSTSARSRSTGTATWWWR